MKIKASITRKTFRTILFEAFIYQIISNNTIGILTNQYLTSNTNNIKKERRIPDRDCSIKIKLNIQNLETHNIGLLFFLKI